MIFLAFILKTLFVITCIFLILCVLLQSGKGGDVAAAFGGAGAQSAFGPRGAAKPLEKATVVAAIVFMVLALLFSLPGFNGQSSVVREGAALPTSSTPSPASSPAASPAASSEASPGASASPAAGKAEEKKDGEKAAAKDAEKKPAASPVASPQKK